MPKSIVHLLNNETVIARLQTTGSGDKIAMSTVTTEMSHIQPINDSKNELSEGVFGRRFRAYFDTGVDVKAGDRLRDDSSNYYTVVSGGVITRSFGSINYKLVIMEKTI